jgi:hypothetical protein
MAMMHEQDERIRVRRLELHRGYAPAKPRLGLGSLILQSHEVEGREREAVEDGPHGQADGLDNARDRPRPHCARYMDEACTYDEQDTPRE